MRKIALMSLLTMIICVRLTAQEKIATDSPLPIMAWAGIPAEETSVERFRELKEMGINVNLSNYPNAEAMQQALDLAQQVGIRMVTSCPELKNEPGTTVRKFMNHPALAGYFLRDEPVRKDFAELGDWAKKIETVDSKHFCFVNLIAGIHTTKTEALGTNTYAEYVSTFAREVPSQLLSFDFYPVLVEGIHERWYEGLEIFSSEARKAGIPFWAFALAYAYNELHPIPTIAALRLQMYSNLAYGAQGLEYWAYWMPESYRSAPIGINGKRTIVYDRIKAVNKEIQDIAGVFVGSKVISVNHTGTIIPRGTTRLSSLPWAIRIFETEGQGALVSVLEKKEKTFFVVVNRDLRKSMTILISGDASLQRVLKDGSIVNADIYDHSTEIEPGDMAVYLFPTKK